MPDALQLLRQDHQEVKELFKRFESAEDRREKQEIADTAIVELVVHSMIEEEIFYPAVREELEGQGEEEEIMFEAEEEHHVVDLLIEELTKGRMGEESFDAKFKVMAENVKHHIQEEESMMLPKAAELGSDRLNQLGEEMYERKMELMREFQGGSRGTSRNGRSPARRRTTRTTRTTGRTRLTGGRATTGSTRRGTTARRTTTTSRSTRRTSTGRATTATRRTPARASSRSRTGRATTSRTSRTRRSR